MFDVEDLRSRELVWRVDPRRRRVCDILEAGRVVGRLRDEKSHQTAEFAGISWRFDRRGVFQNEAILRFDANGPDIASYRLAKEGVVALVDGASLYDWVFDHRLRAKWAIHSAVVSITYRPSWKDREGSYGTIRVFGECPIAQAPVLVLLALHRVVVAHSLLFGTRFDTIGLLKEDLEFNGPSPKPF